MKGKNSNTARAVLVIKDGKIIESFDTVSELYTYFKNNYNPPNSEATIRNRLRDGKEIHGLKLVYKDKYIHS